MQSANRNPFVPDVESCCSGRFWADAQNAPPQQRSGFESGGQGQSHPMLPSQQSLQLTKYTSG